MASSISIQSYRENRQGIERCAQRRVDCRYNRPRVYGKSLRYSESNGWNRISGMSYFGISIVSLSLISESISLRICSRNDLSDSDYVRQRSQYNKERNTSRALSCSPQNTFTLIGHSDKTSAKQSQTFYSRLCVILIG